MFKKKSFRGYQNTHFVFNNFFKKSCHFLDNVKKYCRVGQATDGNVVHVHCMLHA